MLRVQHNCISLFRVLFQLTQNKSWLPEKYNYRLISLNSFSLTFFFIFPHTTFGTHLTHSPLRSHYPLMSLLGNWRIRWMDLRTWNCNNNNEKNHKYANNGSESFCCNAKNLQLFTKHPQNENGDIGERNEIRFYKPKCPVAALHISTPRQEALFLAHQNKNLFAESSFKIVNHLAWARVWARDALLLFLDMERF